MKVPWNIEGVQGGLGLEEDIQIKFSRTATSQRSIWPQAERETTRPDVKVVVDVVVLVWMC